MKKDGKIEKLRQGQAEAICSPNRRRGKEESEPQPLVSLSALVTKDWQSQLQDKPSVLASLNPGGRGKGGGEIMPPPVGPVSCGKKKKNPASNPGIQTPTQPGASGVLHQMPSGERIYCLRPGYSGTLKTRNSQSQVREHGATLP